MRRDNTARVLLLLLLLLVVVLLMHLVLMRKVHLVLLLLVVVRFSSVRQVVKRLLLLRLCEPRSSLGDGRRSCPPRRLNEVPLHRSELPRFRLVLHQLRR